MLPVEAEAGDARLRNQHARGAAREGGVFQLTLHPFVIGYRSRLWIIEQLIEHARTLGKPWFATHAELARWARAESV